MYSILDKYINELMEKLTCIKNFLSYKKKNGILAKLMNRKIKCVGLTSKHIYIYIYYIIIYNPIRKKTSFLITISALKES